MLVANADRNEQLSQATAQHTHTHTHTRTRTHTEAVKVASMLTGDSPRAHALVVFFSHARARACMRTQTATDAWAAAGSQ